MKITRNSIIALALAFIMLAIAGYGVYLLLNMPQPPQVPEPEPVIEKNPDFSKIGAISELASMQCYFHDFCNYEEGANNFLRFGYKKLWIEYGGTVKVGINASRLMVSQPDENGLVTVSLPQANILSIVIDSDSINEITETGLFSEFTTKEKTEVFTLAKQDLEKKTRDNAELLQQGRDRAKKVLEGYIVNVGKALGKEYTVKFIDAK